MRKTLLLIISCVILVACKNKKAIPGGILPQKKMQEVLWDMMRADQFLTDFVINKDTAANRDTESIKLYRSIFAIHHISKKEFRESFLFYNDHPALLKTIMDSIAAKQIAVVPAMEARPDSLVPPAKKIFPRPDTSKRSKRLPKVE